MYYAVCAKLKELLNGVDIHLSNFKAPEDGYFTYTSGTLNRVTPVKFGDFEASLLAQETTLYSHEITDLLNNAVIKKNMRKQRKADRQHKCLDSEELTSGLQDEVTTRKGAFKHKLGWLKEVEGLRNVRDIPCSMIFGDLAEKYRPIVEEEGKEKQDKLPQPQADPSATAEIDCVYESNARCDRYISPYNLIERAKKLDQPGGPELPCICDPECMCTPLCAADITQNCFCEENGLFCRVTEGWDIDDLDVPDRESCGQEALTSANKDRKIQVDKARSASIASPTSSEVVSLLEAQLTLLESTQSRSREEYARITTLPMSSELRTTSIPRYENFSTWVTTPRGEHFYQQRPAAPVDIKRLIHCVATIRFSGLSSSDYSVITGPTSITLDPPWSHGRPINDNNTTNANEAQTGLERGMKRNPGEIALVNLRRIFKRRFQKPKSTSNEIINSMIRCSPFRQPDDPLAFSTL